MGKRHKPEVSTYYETPAPAASSSSPSSWICCRTSLNKAMTILLLLWILSVLPLFYTHMSNPHVVINRGRPTAAAADGGGEAAAATTTTGNDLGAIDADDDCLRSGGGDAVAPPRTGAGALPFGSAPGGGSGSPGDEKLRCFALVVSNEEYVDGALILGYSLYQHSRLARAKKAELVVIVPEQALSDDSIERLHLAGWTRVLQVPDLAKRAPKAHWAGTYNKLYLFNLTQYSLVAFFDADMLVRKNPDFIFDTKIKDAKHIGALGNSLMDRNGNPRKAYFQTGMMLIVPAASTFDAMMDDFENNPESKSINGRDGMIVRRFFDTNYKNLNDELSAHVGVSLDYGWVTGLHFRGGFKPWFNQAVVAPQDAEDNKRTKRKKKEQGKPWVMPPDGKWLEIGPAYALWWRSYEKFHETVLAPRDLAAITARRELCAAAANRKKNASSSASSPSSLLSSGGQEDAALHHRHAFVADAPAGYDPNRHVWLSRHAPMKGGVKKQPYLQLKYSVSQQERDARALRDTGGGDTEFVVSDAGQSCHDACSGHKQKQSTATTKKKKMKRFSCLDSVLASSKLQNCDAVIEHLKPHGCTLVAGSVRSRGVASAESAASQRFIDGDEIGDRRGECTDLAAPTAIQPDTASCSVNNMLSPRFLPPVCNASAADVRRLCLCVAAAAPSGGGSDGAADDHEAEEKRKTRNNSNQGKDEDSVADELADCGADSYHVCADRLREAAVHAGSWFVASPVARIKDKSALFLIHDRHRDAGHDNIVWLPQPHAPVVSRVLFSHLVARVLHIPWVPPTVPVTFPLRALARRLSAMSKRNDDDDDVGGSGQAAALQQHLRPGQCPEVRPALASSGRSLDDDDEKNKESGEHRWSVQGAISSSSFVSSSTSHKQKRRKNALYDRAMPEQLAAASVLHFLLAVPFDPNIHVGSGDEQEQQQQQQQLSWEQFMCKFGTAQHEQLAEQMPGCSFFRAADGKLIKSLPLLADVLAMGEETRPGTAKSDFVGFTARKSHFVKSLKTAGVDGSVWGLEDPEIIRYLMQQSADVANIKARVLALIPVIHSCGLTF